MVYYRPGGHPDTNHYSYPIPLIPVLKAATFELYELQYTPIVRRPSPAFCTSSSFPNSDGAPPLQYGGSSIETVKDLMARGETFPWEKFVSNEYDVEAAAGSLVERDDLKPLEVVQREGVGFKLDGRKLTWGAWRRRLPFDDAVR